MTRAFAPRSPEWHADRAATIGASDAPIITGDSPWGDLLTLYAVKTGLVDEDALSFDSPATRWGIRLEEVVAEWFAETYGKKLRRDNTRPRHPDYPWMATSLDRRVVGEDALVEIKTARYASDGWGTPDTAEVPSYVLVQCQHELAVTGVAVCYVAVLFAGSDPRRYIVPRDEELIAALIEVEADFVEAVRNRTEPAALLRDRRPPVVYVEGEVEADETLALGIEGVYRLRQEIKGLEADLETAQEAVKTILGPATAARAGDYVATYKPNADSYPVRWELVAKAYRKWIEDLDNALVSNAVGVPTIRPDLDAIESIFTDLKPGFRPLRITKKEDER